jgi:hypothetical protein
VYIQLIQVKLLDFTKWRSFFIFLIFELQKILVGISTGYQLENQYLGFDSLKGQHIFLFPTSSNIGGTRLSFPEGESTGREADYLPSFSVEDKTGGPIPPFPIWHHCLFVN